MTTTHTLEIGRVYTDPHIGALRYIGRSGYEYPQGRKGSHVFLCINMRKPNHVTLTKKEVTLLKH